MNLFRALTGRKSRNQESHSFYQTIYPEDVRYALSYKESNMGISEIASLVDRFTNEALYLIVKALEDRETKREYLEDLTRLFLQPDYELNDLKSLLYAWVERIPADTHVAGTKLAQLSRSGVANWQTSFRELAEQCYTENPDALPCLLAHTTILGYRHFVQVYKDLPHAKLVILMPDWIMDPDELQMGYSVTLNPVAEVQLQEKDYCLVGTWLCRKTNCTFNHLYCGNSYFIDDTIHTGSTAAKVQSFWYSEYGLQIANEKIRVITDLRS